MPTFNQLCEQIKNDTGEDFAVCHGKKGAEILPIAKKIVDHYEQDEMSGLKPVYQFIRKVYQIAAANPDQSLYWPTTE